MMILMWSMIVMVEELLRNIAHEELLENRKRGLDDLDMMENASNELPNGAIFSTQYYRRCLILSH
jgi:hypothetical protein